MSNRYLTLHENEYAGGVSTHSDILNKRPVVLSRERAKKVSGMKQEPMIGEKPDPSCLLCHPHKLFGLPNIVSLCDGKVGAFENAAPYLPLDQNVLFIQHADQTVMEEQVHIWQLAQIRKMDLYYLLMGMVELGRDFAQKPLTSTDLPRMIAGFNLGKNAGQSQPHIHSQYGWEIILDKTNIQTLALGLFFEDLRQEDLIVHSSENLGFKLIAPWTPRGQYAVDLYFPGTFEIHRMKEQEAKVFACLGYRILQKYADVDIHNVNIVFDSSPLGREIVPVVAHFVPRVNMTALYEVLGRDVVDTPPSTIYNFFRPMVSNWRDEEEFIGAYDPEVEYNQLSAKSMVSEIAP